MNPLNLLEGLTAVMVLWFLLPYLLKRWQITNLRKVCKNSKAIVLTYDDGPGEILTPALLNVLESNNVHANFFMLGHKIESFPVQALETAAKGHMIGSHSLRHLHAWKSNPVKVRNDIQAGFMKCEQISVSEWFRPPFGKITLATLIQNWITHHRYAWWTIDSTDTWQNPLPVEKIIERVKYENGGVVLMHDHDRNDTAMHNYVIDLTLKLIQLARDEGYVICTFQNLPAH